MYPVDANKNVVIVLGMHRSGTSAIAAGLEQLGLVTVSYTHLTLPTSDLV